MKQEYLLLYLYSYLSPMTKLLHSQPSETLKNCYENSQKKGVGGEGRKDQWVVVTCFQRTESTLPLTLYILRNCGSSVMGDD